MIIFLIYFLLEDLAAYIKKQVHRAKRRREAEDLMYKPMPSPKNPLAIKWI